MEAGNGIIDHYQKITFYKSLSTFILNSLIDLPLDQTKFLTFLYMQKNIFLTCTKPLLVKFSYKYQADI